MKQELGQQETLYLYQLCSDCLAVRDSFYSLGIVGMSLESQFDPVTIQRRVGGARQSFQTFTTSFLVMLILG